MGGNSLRLHRSDYNYVPSSSSCPLGQYNLELATDEDVRVLELPLPVDRLEARREAHVEPAHERREDRPHLVQCERAPDAVPRSCRCGSAWLGEAGRRRRTVVKGHVCTLVECERRAARLGELGAFAGQPALGPERVRVGREVAWVAVDCDTCAQQG
jgi:hypothetical protein